MSNGLKKLNICRLTPEEIEKALLDRYGDKLAPVDHIKLAKKRKQQERHRDNISNSSSAGTSNIIAEKE
jgi:hypothetical protein